MKGFFGPRTLSSWKSVVIIEFILFLVYFYRRPLGGKLRFTLAQQRGSSVLLQKAGDIVASDFADRLIAWVRWIKAF
jgi:hypothetical protein